MMGTHRAEDIMQNGIVGIVLHDSELWAIERRGQSKAESSKVERQVGESQGKQTSSTREYKSELDHASGNGPP
jgi:hypothetical protein